MLGPLVAIVVFTMLGGDGSLGEGGRITAGVLTWMAVWWLSEAIPLAVTAMLPLVVFPLLGVASFSEASTPYAGRVIFLFLGGFLLALGMEQSGLHRRVALMTIHAVGTRPTRMIAGFMLATAVMSMWMSNTAATIMLLPLGVSVVALVREQAGREVPRFGTAMMLGIAYAANIGGLGTPIGTPPNTLLLQSLKDTLGVEVSFLRWMMLAIPLVAVLLPVTWLLLTRVLARPEVNELEGGDTMVRDRLRLLGSVSRSEWTVLSVFLLTVAAWLSRGLIADFAEPGGMLHSFATQRVDDASIAVAAGILLFVIPTSFREVRFVLDWSVTTRVPWGLLLLFGGGLSVAAATRKTGLSDWIGVQLGSLEVLPVVLFVLLVTAAVVFLTEIASNMATASVLIPILIGVAGGLGMDELVLVVPATIGASCAFMMPVATPPNAVVYGSGQVELSSMVKAGIWLNILCIAVITTAAFTLVPWVLGSV